MIKTKTSPSHWLFQETLVLLGFVSLTLIRFSPVIGTLSTGFLGSSRGDPAIYIWLTQFGAERILNFPSVGFSSGLYYPYGYSLGFTDNYLLPALLAKPLLSLGIELALIYNCTLLLCSILNGYITYLLARELGLTTLASFFAGLVFLNSPYLFSHLIHPQLQFAFFLPLVVLQSVKFVKTSSLLHGTSVGLAILACFLCSVYYAIFGVLLAAVALPAARLLIETKQPVSLLAKRLTVANLPTAAALYYITLPYREVAKALGTPTLSEATQHGATLLSYLSAPESNLLWGNTDSWRNVSGVFEAQFFAGAIVSLLAVLGLVSIVRSSSPRQSIGLLSLIVVVFVALSLKSGPYLLLHNYVPGFSAIRAIGRFGIVAFLGIATLSAIGLQLILCYVRATLAALATTAILSAIAVFECWPHSPVVSPEPATPPVWEQLAKIPGNEAVIALPYGSIPELGDLYSIVQTNAMRWSQPTGRPLMNGHAGVMPNFFHYLHQKHLRNFPDPASVRLLSSVVGLRYIVVHRSLLSAADAETFDLQLTNHAELKTLFRDAEGNYLLELLPQAELTLQPLTLRIPPADRDRILELEVNSDKTVGEIEISLMSDKKQRPLLSRTISPTDGWTKLTVPLPPSNSRVNPQLVAVSSKESAEIHVRGFQCR